MSRYAKRIKIYKIALIMLVFVYVVSAFGLYQFANDLYVSGVKCGIYVQQMVDMGTENTQPETEM